VQEGTPVNNFIRRAAILIAMAALTELYGYLAAHLDMVGFEEEVKELTS
jgi:hypothetical protein